jgi:alpha-tubulin suppressor-like RCC1 family protein
LNSATGAYLGANTQHTVTITDDDDPPLVTIQDIYVIEGTSTSFRASLSTPTDKGNVSINWAIDTCVGSDCAVLNTNYTAPASSGTAIIPTGDTFVDFGSINTVDNAADELYQRVPVKLTSVTGGTLYSSKATVFINDNDFAGGTQVVRVENGGTHTCALTTGKRVYCWGKSNYYQTGLNIKTAVYLPTLVTVGTAATDVEFMNVGYEQSCAITTGGALYCWGQGSHSIYGAGSLGNGSGANNTIPTLVTGMTSGVTAVSTGYNNSCAIKDGGVYCWGTGQNYILGRNPGVIKLDNALTPEALPAPLDSGVEKISLRWSHACAIKTGGVAYCWGANTQGQLGLGTVTTGSLPVQLNGYGPIADVWAGSHGTCFKNSLGDVYCMGNNNDMEIKSPATDIEEDITEMPEFKNASHMIYSYVLCGIVSGNLKCHGRNDYGSLGINVAGSILKGTSQTVIGAEADVTWVSSNQEGDFVCFIRDGQVYCTGYGGMGNLGDGYDPAVSTPVLGNGFSGTGGASVLSIGGYHVCGLFNGGVKCWGDNTYYRSGNLLTDMLYQVPTDVKNLSSGVVSLAIGAEGSCALTSAGAVKCWGTGNFRGTGSTTASGNPTTPTGMTSGVTQIASNAGATMVCALKSGEVYCWGSNEYGGVGNGTTTVQNTPYKITAVGNDVIQIAVGANHNCALKADGSVWCAGFNSSGQLGKGDTTNRYTHSQIAGLTAVGISATGNGVCALLANKTLSCWGTFNGTITGAKTSPTAVANLTNVTKIAAGSWNYCVVDDGTFKCWGENTYGQIGLASVSPTTYATPTTSAAYNALGTITDMAIGGNKIFAKVGDNWYATGLDDYQQFGRVQKPFRLAPVSVAPF